MGRREVKVVSFFFHLKSFEKIHFKFLYYLGTVPNSARHNGKKAPISPEQVLRLFGTTTNSSSVPTNYHYSNGTTPRDRGRRSPASSPPSTTHQTYRDRERDRSIPNIHELTTRTVTMSRDQQADGAHGYGICVKGGKETGNKINFSEN